MKTTDPPEWGLWRRWARVVIPGLLGACAQTPTVRRGQVAAELAPAGSRTARTFDGRPISLRDLRARGPVMLVFLRGFS